MEVPEFWAEARRQHRTRSRQVTVRRFGWSNISQTDAQAMAENRAEQALSRVVAGESLPRRERKVAYNGADGLPIREEVLGRYGSTVITRNAYGAHCLNSPDLLFVDVDYETGPRATSILLICVGILVCGVIIRLSVSTLWMAWFFILAFGVLFLTPLVERLWQLWVAWQGGIQAIVRRRVEKFLVQHPEWNIRLYATPAGVRLLVTHQPFDPASGEVEKLFAAVRADKQYRRMCVRQKCFRARLTAKPWRIGISSHMKPRPGVWPVAPERKADRDRWIADYELAAHAYAACRYLESLGSGRIHSELVDVIELHTSTLNRGPTNRLHRCICRIWQEIDKQKDWLQ